MVVFMIVVGTLAAVAAAVASGILLGLHIRADRAAAFAERTSTPVGKIEEGLRKGRGIDKDDTNEYIWAPDRLVPRNGGKDFSEDLKKAPDGCPMASDYKEGM